MTASQLRDEIEFFPASRYPWIDSIPATEGEAQTRLFIGLDVSLRLKKALARRQNHIQLVGNETCPLSEWLYGALSTPALPRSALRLSMRNASYLATYRYRLQ